MNLIKLENDAPIQMTFIILISYTKAYVTSLENYSTSFSGNNNNKQIPQEN